MHLDINNTMNHLDPFRMIFTFISVANVYLKYPHQPQQVWVPVGMLGTWAGKTKYNDLHYKQGDKITNIT